MNLPSLRILWVAICITFASGHSVSENQREVESNASPFRISIFDLPNSYNQQLQNYREKWSRLSGYQYSGLHWNQFISVYTNAGAGAGVYENNHKQFLRWYEDPDDEENEPQYQKYSVGSILLKENYSSENGSPGLPLSLTIMVKREPGYSSTHGDWQFLQFSPKGQILLDGKYSDPEVKESCADCHENVGERDFIFSSMYTSHLNVDRQ